MKYDFCIVSRLYLYSFVFKTGGAFNHRGGPGGMRGGRGRGDMAMRGDRGGRGMMRGRGGMGGRGGRGGMGGPPGLPPPPEVIFYFLKGFFLADFTFVSRFYLPC